MAGQRRTELTRNYGAVIRRRRGGRCDGWRSPAVSGAPGPAPAALEAFPASRAASVAVEIFGGLAALPAFDPDDGARPRCRRRQGGRESVAAADAVVIAAPEMRMAFPGAESAPRLVRRRAKLSPANRSRWWTLFAPLVSRPGVVTRILDRGRTLNRGLVADAAADRPHADAAGDNRHAVARTSRSNGGECLVRRLARREALGALTSAAEVHDP